MLLNGTLERTQVPDFTLRVFYHNKNEYINTPGVQTESFRLSLIYPASPVSCGFKAREPKLPRSSLCLTSPPREALLMIRAGVFVVWSETTYSSVFWGPIYNADSGHPSRPTRFRILARPFASSSCPQRHEQGTEGTPLPGSPFEVPIHKPKPSSAQTPERRVTRNRFSSARFVPF